MKAAKAIYPRHVQVIKWEFLGAQDNFQILQFLSKQKDPQRSTLHHGCRDALIGLIYYQRREIYSPSRFCHVPPPAAPAWLLLSSGALGFEGELPRAATCLVGTICWQAGSGTRCAPDPWRERGEEEGIARRENGLLARALSRSSRVSPSPLITWGETEALKGWSRSRGERGEELE